MTRTLWLNVLAAALSLCVSALLSLPGRAATPLQPTAAATFTAGVSVVQEHGRDGLRDATGHFIPLASYQRIVSTSGVSDSLLLALAEPHRIASFTRYSTQNSPFAYRYADKPVVAELANLEVLVALNPDLVLVNSLGGEERIDRLREAGLTVFDLGEMRGLSTLLPNMVSIATLLGRPEVGRMLATRFERRMRTLATSIPDRERPGAVYLSIYGDSIYGGATGTSYHDVLIAAGLHDAAVPKYRDWPRYTPEALLALDPPIVVTHGGMRRTLCDHAGLDQLRACRTGRVYEIDGTLLDDPSLVMLDAAEALFDAVHGAPPGTAKTRLPLTAAAP